MKIAPLPGALPPAELRPLEVTGEDLGLTVSTTPGAHVGAASFADVFGKFVAETAATDQLAAEKVQGLAAGTQDDLHGTMIAAKEAEISVKLLSNVRNKLLDAFHELWRTNV